MTDLHAVLTARVDELERAYRSAGPLDVLPPSPYAAQTVEDALDSGFVLRGLAEDRDILARHKPDRTPANDPTAWACDACSHEAEDTWYSRWVDWPCSDIRSLARRHNVEVSDHG